MIKEIARRTKLSESAVRRALKDFPDISPATKAKVKALAAELGYRPNFLAQAMVTKKSMLIGIVVPELANGFYPEVIDGFESAAREKSYHILIAKHDWRDDRLAGAVALFGRYQVDGLCFVPAQKKLSPALKEELKFFTKPVVLFDDALDKVPVFPWVGIDDRAAAREATHYLLGKGHRSIAFAGANPLSSSATKRLAGFREALVARGGQEVALTDISGPPGEACGRASVADCLELNNMPQAFLCQNDLVATGVMLECQARGLAVPGQVSVMGFGNLSFSHALSVPLTTVDQSAPAMGRSLFHCLFAQMAGEKYGGDEGPIAHRLVERLSVGDRTRS